MRKLFIMRVTKREASDLRNAYELMLDAPNINSKAERAYSKTSRALLKIVTKSDEELEDCFMELTGDYLSKLYATNMSRYFLLQWLWAFQEILAIEEIKNEEIR